MSRYRVRNLPYERVGDPEQAYSVKKLVEWAACLVGLPRKCDAAIALLDRVEEQVQGGAVARPSRRSMANLRLMRFWLEMAAFHLQALHLFLTELPTRVHLRSDSVVTWIPAVRMSDCLEGYTGRSVTLQEDRALLGSELARVSRKIVQRGIEAGRLQDNFLPRKEEDPDYRALRHPTQVLANLDSRLVPRALRVINAGHEVMLEDGRSPLSGDGNGGPSTPGPGSTSQGPSTPNR